MYKVKTNFGVYYLHDNVGERQIRDKMFEYIRTMMNRGYKLRDIIYCYGPIHKTGLASTSPPSVE